MTFFREKISLQCIWAMTFFRENFMGHRFILEILYGPRLLLGQKKIRTGPPPYLFMTAPLQYPAITNFNVQNVPAIFSQDIYGGEQKLFAIIILYKWYRKGSC